MSYTTTLRLSDERAEWVADQAEQHDASRAWVLRQAVDAARGADSVYADTGTTRTADRLDVLGTRLARIEAAVVDADDAGDVWRLEDSDDRNDPPDTDT